MSTGKEIAKFSPDGEYLAVAGSDGHLRLWESATNRLWSEFIPSAHLAASCTCIEWSPVLADSTAARKKKKKRRTIQGELLVMGTSTGRLLFYDVNKSEALAQSTNETVNAGSVNAVAWSPYTLDLYTCGSDGIAREWNPETCSVTKSWPISKENLTAIRVVNETQVLVAGLAITLWDVKTQKLVTSFTGHPNQISQLELVPSTDYFVSLAQADRHLKIWQMNSQAALVSLSVRESPIRFNVATLKDGSASVGVVTKKGQLHVFQQKLNGPVKKPLNPVANLQILNGPEGTNEKTGDVLPVVASHIGSEGVQTSVLAVYGNWIKLKFERFELKSLSGSQIVSRDVFPSTLKGKQKKGIKAEINGSARISDRIEVPSDVKHLIPGTESVNQLPGASKAAKKKKNAKDDSIDVNDLPMEERLTNLTIDAPARGDLPQVDNLGHLLSQGLHSKDSRILQSVLHRSDEKIITNTIRTFPVQLIVPLIEEIKVQLAGKSTTNHSLLRWLKAIFNIHSAYLMSCASNEELVGPIVSMLRARENLYPQMCLLKGKLELIKGSIAAKQYKSDLPNEALLTYQDESTDEEDQDEDGMLPSESEEFLSDDLGLDGSASEAEAAAGKGSDESESEEEEESDDGESGHDDMESDEDGKPTTNGMNGASGSESSMEED